MECPKCKKQVSIPNKVYRYLETYNADNGYALTISDCCCAGFIVNSQITFKITEYTGDKKEDDWGSKIKETIR